MDGLMNFQLAKAYCTYSPEHLHMKNENAQTFLPPTIQYDEN